jgi:hypothetical protein
MLCLRNECEVRKGAGSEFVWFLAGAKYFSLLRNFLTSSGADSASYSVGTDSSFIGVKQLWNKANDTSFVC